MGYPRFMRRRGFGVHSPFAYRFITEVIGERYAYYDYARLSTENDRLLYRVAACLQPCKIQEGERKMAAPARLACPKHGAAHLEPPLWTGIKKTNLMVGRPSDVKALEADTVLFLHALPYEQKAIKENPYPGLNYLLKRECVAIIIPFPHLPCQVLEL